MTQAQQNHRMIVPDIARGLALLGIALANVPTAWAPASPELRASSLGGVVHAADVPTVMVTAVTAHSRGLPMFSTLLGFGVGLLAMSLWRKGYPLPAARGRLILRYGILALFGIIHGVLLFFGDIMMLYGFAGIVLAVLMPMRNKALMTTAWVLLGIWLALGLLSTMIVAFLGAGMDVFAVPGAGASYGETLGINANWMLSQLTTLPVFLLSYLPVMLIGFVWARRGVLAHVDKHRPMLWRWVITGAVVAAGVGIPWGLAALGVLPAGWEPGLAMLNSLLGVLTGPAILAGLALACEGTQRKVDAGGTMPLPLQVAAALGKRSMSGYILQSIVLFILVQPYLLGLGANAGATMLGLMAAGAWAAMLIAAWVWEKMGWQGPFEWVHRHLAYGRTGALPARKPLEQ
ncbi:DUF418 domain-containing protein [Corynebacterium endometrii]|nr:DUF418 domain-containing protein [Corynebacterium endometrii]